MRALRTKTAKREFFSRILAVYKDQRGRCARLTADPELALVTELLTWHPDWETKGAGVEWIGVHDGHFCLVRDGGRQHADISFHKCLSPPTRRTELIRACRDAIENEVREARVEVFASAPTPVCAMPGCGATLVDDATTHLDHITPFRTLFDDWLAAVSPPRSTR
jgi:hypothetical protein